MSRMVEEETTLEYAIFLVDVGLLIDISDWTYKEYSLRIFRILLKGMGAEIWEA